MRLLIASLVLLMSSQAAFADSYVASCVLQKNYDANLAKAIIPLSYAWLGDGAGDYSGVQTLVLEGQPFRIYIDEYEGEGKPGVDVELSLMTSDGETALWSASSETGMTTFSSEVNVGVVHDESGSRYELNCQLAHNN